MANLKNTVVLGKLTATDSIVANKFIINGGLSTDLLLAGGGTTSLTTINDKFDELSTSINNIKADYLLLDGGIMTGPLTITPYDGNKGGLANRTATYDKILVASDAGLIGYRTKKEFVQDLAISQVYNFKGALANLDALKAITSAEVGDVYFLSDTYHSWACKEKVTAATGNSYGTFWNDLGKNVDLSGYVTLNTDQTITGSKTFNSINTLNMNGNGPLTFPTTKNSGWSNHYISAGCGCGTTAGKHGVKLICCDQNDAITGIGQDLSNRGNGYDLSIVGSASAAGHCTISFVTNSVDGNTLRPSTGYTTLGYWTEGGHLYAVGNIYGSNLGSVSNIWTSANVYQLNLHKGKNAKGGRISFYNGTTNNNNYTTWFEYMSDTTQGTCPTGGTPSSYGGVNSWALRSLVENNKEYGWIWEAISGPTATGDPTAVMSLHANNGDLTVLGTVQAASFTNGGNMYMKISNSNEISFATAPGTASSKNNKIYFGYQNNFGTAVNDNNRVDTYVFGQHNGDTNNSSFRGHIECGTVSLNSTTAGTKATFEYNTDDKCIDVKFN